MERHTPIPAASTLLRALLILSALLALTGLYDRLTLPEPCFRIHQQRIIEGSVPLEGLHNGDILLAVNGIPLEGDHQGRALLAREGGRGEMLLRVERDGRTLEVPYSGVGDGLMGRRANSILRTLAGLLILLVAFQVLRRRQDHLAQLFVLLCVILGSLLAPQIRVLAEPWRLLLELGSDLLSFSLSPLLLHFLILFPESRRRGLWLRLLIYLPSLAWVLLDWAALLFLGEPSRIQLPLMAIAGLHSALLLGIALVLLIAKSFRRKHRRERYRLRLVLVGGLIGLLPLVLFQLLHQLFPHKVVTASSWTLVFLVFVPISFAYGLLGRDLLVLQRRAERTGRQILQGGSFFLLFVILQTAFLGLGSGSQGPMERLAEGAFLVLLTTLIWFPIWRRLPAAVRGEEREELPHSRPIMEGQQPSVSLDQLIATLSPALGKDLDCRWILWLFRKDGSWLERRRWLAPDLENEGLLYEQQGLEIDLPEGLQKQLLGGRALLAPELWDPYWAENVLGGEALSFCKERKWSLILSLPGDGSSSLLLVVGPSSQRGLHSPRRLSSLHSLLPSLDLQLKNLSLLERLAEEEALQRELILARRIQERLLPKSPPLREGMELIGKMSPSREVGGDYYDFLELPDGRLGLALGDATGKGVPAALLMAGAAQAFRGLAPGRSPDRVLAEMNRSLSDPQSTTEFRGFFAAFFYGLLDPSSGLFCFCNGGMPDPWLLRRNGRLERLHRGGPLLGINAEGSYQEGRILLNKGDLLFLRSDGLEEQLNEKSEMFGEDRLLKWMRSHRSLPVEDLSEELFSLIDDFAGRAGRDDISLILLRLIRESE